MRFSFRLDKTTKYLKIRLLLESKVGEKPWDPPEGNVTKSKKIFLTKKNVRASGGRKQSWFLTAPYEAWPSQCARCHTSVHWLSLHFPSSGRDFICLEESFIRISFQMCSSFLLYFLFINFCLYSLSSGSFCRSRSNFLEL